MWVSLGLGWTRTPGTPNWGCPVRQTTYQAFIRCMQKTSGTKCSWSQEKFHFSRGKENNHPKFFSLYLQWTYCLAAFVVIGAAVWFYFITQSIKSVTYAPTILVGAGTSAMIVMSLTYLTDLIGEDKVCTLSWVFFHAYCILMLLRTVQQLLASIWYGWCYRAW